jgi:uracil-DNA glycosylase family 4
MTKTEELKNVLSSKGLRYVDTRGNLSSPVCLAGEAPGADEDQEGKPFVGAAGRELDRMLAEAGIEGDSCWWTNPYKTRPPDNKLDRLHELGVPTELFELQFFEELAQHKPTIIGALGATPLGILCPFTRSYKKPFRAKIGTYAGSILTSPFLPWEHYVIPNYHPAYLFRQWSDRPITVLILAKIAEELKFFKEHGKLNPLPVRELLADPTWDDCYSFLTEALEKKFRLSTDIENIGVYRGKKEFKTPQMNRLPYVIGFAPSASRAISIGLTEYENDKSKILWRLIDKVLSSLRQIGQNFYTHDAPWLEYSGFSPNIGLLDDTLVRHHVLWPELSHKLEFQCMQYTREPYYKDEGKNWTVKEKTSMKRYNAKDCCVTYEVWERQEEEFDERV